MVGRRRARWTPRCSLPPSHCGRTPKLTAEQIRSGPRLPRHGPEPDGFRGDVWTRTGSPVSFTRSSAFRTAKARCRASSSVGAGPRKSPITGRSKRNEEAIERGGSSVARAEGEGTPPAPDHCFRGRVGASSSAWGGQDLCPAGETPVLDEWQTRDHLSVMGGVTPQGKVYSLVRPHSFHGLHSVAFLAHRLRVVGGRLLVIWDGSPIHRRADVEALLADQAGTISIRQRCPPRPAETSTRWNGCGST